MVLVKIKHWEQDWSCSLILHPMGRVTLGKALNLSELQSQL